MGFQCAEENEGQRVGRVGHGLQYLARFTCLVPPSIPFSCKVQSQKLPAAAGAINILEGDFLLGTESVDQGPQNHGLWLIKH